VAWDKINRAGRAAGEILHGMTTFGWMRAAQRQRGEMERLFLLSLFGDLVGIPLLPPYFSLRLLPYILPVIHSWKRGILRESDWADRIGSSGGID
jgi:hypothetical protein